MRTLFFAAALAGAAVASADAVPVAFEATGTEVAALGDFHPTTGLSPIPFGYFLGGQWNVDSDFSTGIDRLAGVSSPVASAIIDFSIVSFGQLYDNTAAPVPGASLTSSVTSLFYYDDVVVDAAYLAGIGLDGIVPYGTYDLFQIVAPETIAVQHPITGEFFPAAPPGDGTAIEVTLTIAAASDWFIGPQIGLLPLPTNYLTVIDAAQYNESGDITGRAVALVNPFDVPAPAPLAILSVLAATLFIRRKSDC